MNAQQRTKRRGRIIRYRLDPATSALVDRRLQSSREFRFHDRSSQTERIADLVLQTFPGGLGRHDERRDGMLFSVSEIPVHVLASVTTRGIAQDTAAAQRSAS